MSDSKGVLFTREGAHMFLIHATFVCWGRIASGSFHVCSMIFENMFRPAAIMIAYVIGVGAG